jgi:tetratricopeptide (TPR) repeat protein
VLELVIPCHPYNPQIREVLNLGEAYIALRRIPEAVACYRRALELKPDLVAAHINLGGALRQGQRAL